MLVTEALDATGTGAYQCTAPATGTMTFDDGRVVRITGEADYLITSHDGRSIDYGPSGGGLLFGGGGYYFEDCGAPVNSPAAPGVLSSGIILMSKATTGGYVTVGSWVIER
jgi:hypothetical protein